MFYHTEVSSLEETRGQFNGGKADIKLGIDVYQDFYAVVMQEGGSNPKPPQRFHKQAFHVYAQEKEPELKPWVQIDCSFPPLLKITEPHAVTVTGKPFYDIAHAPADHSKRRTDLQGYADCEIHPVTKLDGQ